MTMTECDRAQAGMDIQHPFLRDGLPNHIRAHVAECDACRLHVDVAAACMADLRSRAAGAADAPQARRMLDAALTAKRRTRAAILALLCFDLLGAAACLVFIGWSWALALFAVTVPPQAAALWYVSVHHRRLIERAAQGGELFAVLRADLGARIARVQWCAPVLIVGGVAMALLAASELPYQAASRNALAAGQILFDAGFIGLGVYLLTRLPAMRRESDDLKTSGDA